MGLERLDRDADSTPQRLHLLSYTLNQFGGAGPTDERRELRRSTAGCPHGWSGCHASYRGARQQSGQNGVSQVLLKREGASGIGGQLSTAGPCTARCARRAG